MIKAKSFRKKDLNKLSEINPDLYNRIKEHGDYNIQNCVAIVDENDSLVGAGALSYDATFRYLESEKYGLDSVELDHYYLNAEFFMTQCEDEALGYYLISEEFDNILEKTRRKYKKNNINIRLFCRADQNATMEFYLMQGYKAEKIMLVLDYDFNNTEILATIDCEDDDMEEYDYATDYNEAADYDKNSPNAQETSELVLPKGFEIKEIIFDDISMNSYLRSNTLGFDTQDSEAEMWYRINNGAKVYAVCKKDLIISSVTVWKKRDGVIATENIFTIPKYRGRGFAGYLISNVLDKYSEDYDMAELTVYGDNRATDLYFDLGYELKYSLIEMVK